MSNLPKPISRKSEKPKLWQDSVRVLTLAQRFRKKWGLREREAVWKAKLDHPDLPLALLLATDIHFGNFQTNYKLLESHLDLVENTPNFAMVSNGDDVDNFNVIGKSATGVYEDPLPPQFQTQAFVERIKRIGAKGKLGAWSYGNHGNMVAVAGYDWLETFAQEVKTNIFTAGGFLHILVGKQHYGLAITHKYWGRSKKNATNACKNFLDFEYPQADIVFLGDSHQSEMLFFERGGREIIASIGGTYKQEEIWARQQGIGGRGGSPGHTVLLFPNEHKMIGLKHIEDAVVLMRLLIRRRGLN